MKHRTALRLLLVASVGCGAAPSDGPTPIESAAVTPTSRYDALFAEAWSAQGLAPTPVDDDTFLRRATLDLFGRIPTKDELLAFRTDTSADKRARRVDAMLDDQEHASHLARHWERLLLGPEVKLRLVDRGAMRRWLEDQFAKDVGWDAIVRGLVAAEGTSSAGGSVRDALTQADATLREAERKDGVNGATNYALRFRKNPQDLAGHVSKTFLGVQIQCAQCHDHKTEAWTQTQFREFASPFLYARAKPTSKAKGEMATFDLERVDAPPRRLRKMDDLAGIATATPRALDGTALGGDDPRGALAGWITSKENPWFAKALVNRVWADLHGVGFIDPVDDVRAGSEVVLPAVLEALANDFESSGFDLDGLYRTILLGPTYRASIDGTRSPRETLFTTVDLVPMSSDALLDSVFTAAEVDRRLLAGEPDKARALEAAMRSRMEFVFDGDSESNAAGSSTTLPQALFLANSALVTAATSHAEGSMLESVLRTEKDDAAVVRDLFQRTLSRDPTAEELTALGSLAGEQRAPAKLSIDAPRGVGKARREARLDAALLRATRPVERDARARAYEDLFWALLNSNEFLFRR